MTKRVRGYDGRRRSRGRQAGNGDAQAARTDDSQPPSYEDRMETIVRGLRIGNSSGIKREAADFIQEQAAMIVRLEAELETAYA